MRRDESMNEVPYVYSHVETITYVHTLHMYTHMLKQLYMYIH